MLVFPNAKINLGLTIVEKRSDGFHNIETVFYPIALCDVLEIVENTTNTKHPIIFTSSGIDIPGKADENLCVKAYHLIAKDYPLRAIKIHLHKIIPIGAGLGGGSSDAAFFLKAINKLFDLSLSFGELHHYARQLGSDCSFFINNRATFAEGKGDEMESCSVNLAGYFIVLVKPEIHISTQQAYALVKPSKPKKTLEELILQPIEDWKTTIQNQFEDSVFPQHPTIKTIKEQLYSSGAVYAAMSGSGSSVFGIFKKEMDLKNSFTGCFMWYGRLQ